MRDFYRPGQLDNYKPVLADRKERFADLNKFVRERGGWLTSIPGEREVVMQCLPDSPLPDELRKRGYVVETDGESERILPMAIVERFVRGADGGLVPITAGSTARVVETRHHAGIAKVEVFRFIMR